MAGWPREGPDVPDKLRLVAHDGQKKHQQECVCWLMKMEHPRIDLLLGTARSRCPRRVFRTQLFFIVLGSVFCLGQALSLSWALASLSF